MIKAILKKYINKKAIEMIERGEFDIDDKLKKYMDSNLESSVYYEYYAHSIAEGLAHSSGFIQLIIDEINKRQLIK